MEVKKYEAHGRRLIVEFKCQRCKTISDRPLEICMEEVKECYRELYDLRPPKDWRDGGFYYPLLCPRCAEAYDAFMEMKEVK